VTAGARVVAGSEATFGRDFRHRDRTRKSLRFFKPPKTFKCSLKYIEMMVTLQ
jgi:hypothetical protein